MRFGILILLLCLSSLAQATGMVVSTHPLYLIAQAVTQGVESPILLLTPSQSGHDVQLRPKERQLLKESDFVLWFGPSYEAPLAKILQGQPNAIALFDLKAFRRQPLRDVQGNPQAHTLDPHIWLDPVNAIAIAHAIAAVRSRQFPQFSRQYQQNAARFSQGMLVQMTKLRSKTKQPANYWVYHDAYQYVEPALNLHFKGALTVDHDLPPTVAQLKWLQQTRPTQAGRAVPMCLLAESQVALSTIQRLQPTVMQPVDETMLGQQDFIAAWAVLAQQIIDCTQFAR